jgi:predicted transcriptional regulator
MEVTFTPEQEAELAKLASSSGKQPPELVRETMGRILDDHARFIAGVNRGLASVERGEFVEHEEVLERIEQRFRS